MIGSRRCATPAATSSGRPATRLSSSATSTPPSTASRTSTGPTSTARSRPPRSWPARTSRRPAPSWPRTARARSTCSGFASQLVFNTFHNRRLRDWSTAATSTWPSARPERTTAGWSSSAPSTAGCCRPATCPSPTSSAPRRWPRRPSAWARRRCWSPPAARPRTRPATSASTRVWARAEEAGIPVVFHVGGTGDLIEPAYFDNGLPSRPTSTAARRTSARSTTWASPTRRPRRWRR